MEMKLKRPPMNFTRFIKRFLSYLSNFAFLIPYITLFAIFFIYPFFYGLYISLFKWNIFDPNVTEFVGFNNYYRILFEQGGLYFNYFWGGLGNTVLFVVISVPVLILIALLIALLLDIQPPGYRLLRVIFFMPTVFSISAVILIWRWQFNNSGFINSLLVSLGLEKVPFLSTQPWAWISILIVTVWWTIGTNMVIIGAGLKDIDKSLYEAAEIDGANYFQQLRYISVPGVANQLFTITILTTIASFNIYGQPELLTNGGPDFTTTVLMMRIRSLPFGSNPQPGIASAMSVILGLIMIAISLIQSKVAKKVGD